MELPETLILGPGGAKGFMILGSLKVLKNHGILNDVKRYVGISIGSSIALLLVCGYEVLDIVYDALDIPNIFTDFNKNFNILKLIKETAENGGLLSNQKIYERLCSRVKKKFGFIPNLKQLFLTTGLELVTVSLNLTKDRTEYISYLNYPEMSCVDAVMLSMNIPIVFHKIRYNNDIYVDGALGDPYPAGRYPNSLGIIIYTTYSEIDEDNISYFSNIIGCSINQFTKRELEKCKTIVIPNGKYYLDNISPKDRMDMYHHGYDTTVEYLKKLGLN